MTNEPENLTVLKARYVVPIEGPVLEDGAVEIRQGRIVRCVEADQLSGGDCADACVVDYGDAVITPGLVNAHTHLELSSLAGLVPPDGTRDLVSWLKRLMAIAPNVDDEQALVKSVTDGIRASVQAGVTSVGDITRFPSCVRKLLAESGISAVSFGEVIAIGQRRSLLAERLGAAIDASAQTDRVRVGVSPHSPYTVEPAAMEACAQRAVTARVPLCIHLSETTAEAEFTCAGSGAFADYLREIGVWDDEIPCVGLTPVDFANRSGILTERTIVAHGNYLTDGEMELLSRAGTSVAYCPRTHEAFGHGLHPFRRLEKVGVNVCVGTDSLASNPDLSIMEELRFLRRRFPEVSPLTLMEMGTLRGARALGLSDEVGSIRSGKVADLAVWPCQSGSGSCGWEEVFSSSSEPMAVFLAGELVQS